ncbi:Nicotinate phosphoribosyltransferase pncB2 [bioreactor metagenome]|uniref:nicotinate phosphoribosyltransferase n=1 Tax=bioreactor metagenome TaxID=1076179 RepID=A0A644XN25_9ZZZZ
MRNLTMLTDLYQLTMMYGYFKEGMQDNQGIFDLFFRPKEDIVYAIMAGTESVVNYINDIHFTDEDVDYLRSLKLFDEDFLNYLLTFRFTGELYAMPEGTVVFPYEPLVRVRAPIMEAQLVETAILTFVNHQTLIATKASRICYAANGDSVLEFGLRRAQGADAAIYGARAAIIGGCNATSNVLTGQMFDIPVSGTHAHSWVMSFPDEVSAFRAYAKVFPDTCLLLVDTYDTLRSGVPNAIKVFDELRAAGHEPKGIRLDSGDLAYLSKKARIMLDKAGYPNAVIAASSDLDEFLIRDLKTQGACISVWGVGTRLITSEGNSALGGVYKMSAEIVEGQLVPKIKISDNPAKVTNPGYKKVFRLYDKDGMAIADLIALENETIDSSKPLRIFDPIQTYKSMTLTDYTVRELLVPVFVDGKQVYQCPDIHEIATYAKKEFASMWDEYKRLLMPHTYKVDLSDSLYDLKQKLLRESVGSQI